MDLKTTIQNDMKTAMKAGDPLKLGTIRMLISEIKRKEIDKRSALDEGEIQKTISSMLKQRLDSIEAFEKGGRADLVEKEKKEMEFLKVYQPLQLSETEIEALVDAVIKETGAVGPADIGKVMKGAVSKAAGRAEGKLVNEIARKKLAK